MTDPWKSWGKRPCGRSVPRRPKREGATGAPATLASNRGPSPLRSTAHGSRLPAISRRGAASRLDNKLATAEPENAMNAPKPFKHQGLCVGVLAVRVRGNADGSAIEAYVLED